MNLSVSLGLSLESNLNARLPVRSFSIADHARLTGVNIDVDRSFAVLARRPGGQNELNLAIERIWLGRNLVALRQHFDVVGLIDPNVVALEKDEQFTEPLANGQLAVRFSSARLLPLQLRLEASS